MNVTVPTAIPTGRQAGSSFPACLPLHPNPQPAPALSERTFMNPALLPQLERGSKNPQGSSDVYCFSERDAGGDSSGRPPPPLPSLAHLRQTEHKEIKLLPFLSPVFRFTYLAGVTTATKLGEFLKNPVPNRPATEQLQCSKQGKGPGAGQRVI